jgi:lipopolysaccharide transport system ATP-binding protein
MRLIIKIENVSKRYRIGGLNPGYITFREMLGGIVTAPFRRFTSERNDSSRTLWALKNVSLEIHPGELVGIIGHNGAGKSTLLKILSRVTKPTTGRVKLFGRVGSLLEVGTGFHPDLTGRENIYLNGAVLGMRRAEIERKFDEIVAFSEIERFIETPVKWYSSGMYVKLAFSVAAHLEPEILIMDEVLAVGDAAFQQKCLNKMHEIRQQGRTILFVSHNMPAITRLCKRVILIDGGKIHSDGLSHDVVNSYLHSIWKIGPEKVFTEQESAGTGSKVRIRRVRIRDESGQSVTAVDIRRPVGIDVTYEVSTPDLILTPAVEISNEEGMLIFSAFDVGDEWRRTRRPCGTYTSTAWIPGNMLNAGNLIASVSVVSHLPATKMHAESRNVAAFHVVDTQEGDSARGDYKGPIEGLLRPLLEWTTRLE